MTNIQPIAEQSPDIELNDLSIEGIWIKYVFVKA